jgi:hypothetical protein
MHCITTIVCAARFLDMVARMGEGRANQAHPQHSAFKKILN